MQHCMSDEHKLFSLSVLQKHLQKQKVNFKAHKKEITYLFI